MKRAKKYEIREVVTSCASCEKSLKDYIKWVGDDIPAEDVQLLQNVIVKNIYEYLRENDVKFRFKKAQKVTYHKPCNINDFSDIEWLLNSIENLEYIEMQDFGKCCGLNGVSKIKEYKVMSKIFNSKRTNIKNAGVKIVLTSCLGCEAALKVYSFGQYNVADLIDFIAKNI